MYELCSEKMVDQCECLHCIRNQNNVLSCIYMLTFVLFSRYIFHSMFISNTNTIIYTSCGIDYGPVLRNSTFFAYYGCLIYFHHNDFAFKEGKACYMRVAVWPSVITFRGRHTIYASSLFKSAACNSMKNWRKF